MQSHYQVEMDGFIYVMNERCQREYPLMFLIRWLMNGKKVWTDSGDGGYYRVCSR